MTQKYDLDKLFVASNISWRDFRNIISQRKAIKYRKNGMTAMEADEAAIKCGFHPIEIWGNDWVNYE